MKGLYNKNWEGGVTQTQDRKQVRIKTYRGNIRNLKTLHVLFHFT